MLAKITTSLFLLLFSVAPTVGHACQQGQQLPVPLSVSGHLKDVDGLPYFSTARVVAQQTFTDANGEVDRLWAIAVATTQANGYFDVDLGSQVFDTSQPVKFTIEPGNANGDYAPWTYAGSDPHAMRGLVLQSSVVNIGNATSPDYQAQIGRREFVLAPQVGTLTLNDAVAASHNVAVCCINFEGDLPGPFAADELITLYAGQAQAIYSWRISNEWCTNSVAQNGRVTQFQDFVAGASVDITTIPVMEVLISVDMAAHPDAKRWAVFKASEWQAFNGDTSSANAWTGSVFFRTHGRGRLASTTKRRIEKMAPGAYKIELWSASPTTNGAPLGVYDLTLTDQDVDFVLN